MTVTIHLTNPALPPEGTSVHDYTLRQLLLLPTFDWAHTPECSSVVIVPTGEEHDSGYGTIGFVPCVNHLPLGFHGGGSDVIHVDGIGGYKSKGWGIQEAIKAAALLKAAPHKMLVPASGWSIDLLPKSGCFHMWPQTQKMSLGHALSSMEMFALP